MLFGIVFADLVDDLLCRRADGAEILPGPTFAINIENRLDVIVIHDLRRDSAVVVAMFERCCVASPPRRDFRTPALSGLVKRQRMPIPPRHRWSRTCREARWASASAMRASPIFRCGVWAPI